MGECWDHRTATFMILGNICTRSCGFCSVPSGKPVGPPEEDEPERVAEAVAKMGLRYAVVTSVNRDDQPDGGSAIFARTISEIRRRVPGCRVEILIPDFRGEWSALETVLEARPDVLNHNMETVPRLYRKVRPQAHYRQSLDVLAFARRHAPGVLTKSGFMVGLGETEEEVHTLLRDLHANGTDVATIGQYLQPTRRNLPVSAYVDPAQFDAYRDYGLALGFKMVFSGPLVRSSYMADEVSEEARRTLC
jgi:lipoic acid synthetase